MTDARQIEQAKKELGKLLLFGQHANAGERKAKFDLFWGVLSRLPPHFVVEACQYAARGSLGKLCYLEPGDLYHAAAEFAARAARETKRLEPSSKSEIVNPEMKERIAKGLKALVGEIARKSRAFGPPEKKAPYRASTGPLEISDELKMMINRKLELNNQP